MALEIDCWKILKLEWDDYSSTYDLSTFYGLISNKLRQYKSLSYTLLINGVKCVPLHLHQLPIRSSVEEQEHDTLYRKWLLLQEIICISSLIHYLVWPLISWMTEPIALHQNCLRDDIFQSGSRLFISGSHQIWRPDITS